MGRYCKNCLFDQVCSLTCFRIPTGMQLYRPLNLNLIIKCKSDSQIQGHTSMYVKIQMLFLFNGTKQPLQREKEYENMLGASVSVVIRIVYSPVVLRIWEKKSWNSPMHALLLSTSVSSKLNKNNPIFCRDLHRRSVCTTRVMTPPWWRRPWQPCSMMGRQCTGQQKTVAFPRTHWGIDSLPKDFLNQSVQSVIMRFANLLTE